MPEVTKHEPGMFSWADLGTTDVAAAKKFYTGLFGWTYQDDPMGPDEVYSRALLNGKTVGAMYKQRPDQAKMGIPPYWASYVTVTDVDATAKKVGAAGGKLLMEPFDVFDAGRMCVLADPSGGAICAWQPKKHIGAQVTNEHGALTWAELMSTNVDAAGKFYQTVFGWTAQAMPMPNGTYTVFNAGGKPATGMMGMPPEMKSRNVPSHWGIYFQVSNTDQIVDKAKSSGGKVLMPATDFPGVGRIAALQDPQGVYFGIIQPAPR